jgi:hypothetical protein
MEIIYIVISVYVLNFFYHLKLVRVIVQIAKIQHPAKLVFKHID